MSWEYNGTLVAGGCCHVWTARYHIAVVQLVLGERIQTGLDGCDIIQNVVWPTAFKASWRHVDSSEVTGV